MPIRRKPADDYSRFDETDLPQDAASAVDGYSQFDATDIPQEPPPAPPPPPPEDVDPAWGDYGRQVMAGGAQVGGGVGWLLEKMGAETVGGAIKRRSMESAATWQEGLSEQAKAAMQQDFLGESKWGDKWKKAKLIAASSMLGSMAGMGVGGAATKGLTALSKAAQPAMGAAFGASVPATAALETGALAAGKAAAAIGYGAGEAFVAGTSAGAQTQDLVLRMKHAEMLQSPEYTAAYEAYSDLPEAKRQQKAKALVADAAAGDAAALTALSTFVLSAPFSTTLGRAVGVIPGAKTRLGGFVTGATEEPIQEFLQSGAEQMAQNLAMRRADPNRPVMQGALEQAIGGALAGAPLGAASGVMGGRDLPGPTPAAKREPSILDEIAKAQQEPPSTGEAEIADLEATQDKARAAAEAQGGDALDQEVAASQAALDQTAAARQNKDAAFAYAEQQIKAMQDQAKSVAFDTAEETAAARKPIEQDILARQGEAQAAIDAAKGAPETAAPATLADVWPAKPATLAERRAQAAPAPKPTATPAVEAPAAAAAPLALPAPKQGPTIQTREFRTGKKGQRLKGTGPVTREGGGTIVVDREGGARVPSENEPTVPGVKTGYGTLAIRRQAIAEERVRTPVVETTRQQVEQPVEQPVEATATEFTTAKGSTYVVEPGGQTTRNKAARPEHPGVAERGPQPTSEDTFYVTPEDANALGEFQAQGGPAKVIAPLGDGRYGVKYTEGPSTGKFERRTVVAAQREPAVGLTPVELWKGGNRVHFGNAITEVRRAPAEAPQTLAERQAQKTKRGEPVRQRAEKTEPRERPATPPKPAFIGPLRGKPAAIPVSETARPQGPTLAERRMQSAAAKAKNAVAGKIAESAARAEAGTAEAVAEAKTAVEQKAEAPKTEGPKLRYGETLTLRPKWKRSVSPDGFARWDYGKRGSVEERVDAEGNSRFFAKLTLRSSKGAFDMSDKLGHLTEEAAKEYVERYSKQGETLQALDNTFAQARDTISRDFKAVPPEERRPVGVPGPEPKPKPVSIVDAQAAVQRYTDKLGSSYQVLRSPEQAPPHIYEQMKKDGRLDAPGVYDIDNDVAYTFADNNVTIEDVQRNAAHEVVAHMGWRRLGSAQEHNETMEQVFSMAEDKTWMQKFMTGHGLNENNPADRLLAADEYASHVAESGTDLPVFKKMVAYARFLLRKMNPNLTWTEDDIRLMLFRAKTNLLKGSGHAWHWPKQTGIRYASKATPASALKAGPEGMAIRQDMTLEQLSQYNPNTIRSRWSAVQDIAHGRKETIMALVHLNNLPDFVAPGKMDSAGKYALEVDNTEGDFSAEIGQYAPLAEKAGKFVRKNPQIADKLAELMHAATLSRADPAQDYKPLHSGLRKGKAVELTDAQKAENRAHQRAWQVMRTHWDALGKMGFMGKAGKDAQALYVEIRDAYAQLNKDIWAALEQRISETNSDAEHKSTLLATLRKEFEHGSVAPYFSLFRKGKFWAVAKRLKTAEELERAPAKTEADKWVVEYFVRSDHSAEIEAFQANMKRAGYETPSGEVKGSDQEILDSVDPAFVAKITELTKDQGSKQLADEIWQLYLQRLPEMSIRKHYAHRKGRLGFTKDFVQAYSHHMFHGAHQLARMRHVYKLETHLQNATKELRALEEENDPEKTWAAPLLRELQRRHQWVMNPETAGWSNLMAAGGFFWYLANSPAAAAVNMSQTFLTTLPNLAARFGVGTAIREIGHAMRLWGSARGPLANRTRGWERAVMDEAMRTNLFQTTNMHTMVSMGEEGVSYGGRMERTLEVAAYLFHTAEKFNREVTYLAAARAYGNRHPQTEGESTEVFVARTAAYARKAVFDTQGNYANTNRPRLLQGNAMKVIGLFRQYAFFMSYRMIRDFDTSTTLPKNRPANETEEQFTQRRGEARKQFLGTLSQVALFTGVRGFPLYWAAQMIANAIWGDDDDPYDVDAAMQKQLEDRHGETVASIIMEGPVATAMGSKLSNRIGMNNMVFQETPSNKYGADLAAFFMTQLGGPYISTLYNTADWLYPKEEGYEDRAFEKVIPKWVRDPMRTIRFAQEGVTTKTGDEIIPRRELSEWDLAVQGFGFSPLKVATAHERNRAAQGHALKLRRREDNLRNKFYKYHNQIVIATKAEDAKAVAEATKAQAAVMAEMQQYVAKNPTSSLLAEIGGSVRDRKRREVMSVRGIYLDRRLRHLYDRYGVKAPEPPPEEEAE